MAGRRLMRGAAVFPEFEFTTVEPDSWVVAYGPKLFHPDPAAAIAKAASLLRAGGMLMVRIFNRERLNALFQCFTETTPATLPAFGRSDVAIVWPLNLLRDLARVQDF